MKTIGLIGGTGWVSTAEYYRIINETVNQRLGGLQFAKCILYSLNFGDIDELNRRDDMPGIFKLILDAAVKLMKTGVDGIMLCANTMHMFADELATKIDVPLIHIAEATAREIKKKNMSTVGLLGTKKTMELDFYKNKLKAATIEMLVPESDEREFINRTIYTELLLEVFKDESKRRFLDIMKRLQQQGAQGIILGCTEIPLLIKQDDTELPLFDTTFIHAQAAVDFALS